MNDEQIETEIKVNGLTAPRITLADIEANIDREQYFTAAHGVLGALIDDEVPMFEDDQHPNSPLHCVTICVMRLRNGHKIIGVNEGPVSAANFDPELGCKLARQKAIDQIWPLMGYELRSKLAVIENLKAGN